jgi:aspartate 1-decarboxylase
MLIPFLISKIHKATVTATYIDYSGSITIDPLIMEKSNLRQFQKVEIYDITNGNRFATYVIAGESGAGQIEINGAAARLVSVDDKIIIAAYALLDERELNTLHSVLLVMGENNRIERIINGKL